MKKGRKMLCMIMAAATALSLSITANAESTIDDGVCTFETEMTVDSDDKNLVLVSSEDVVLDDGQIVEVDTYLEDGVMALADKKGSQYYKCTAKFKENDEVQVMIWVEGTFSWDSDNNSAKVGGAYGNRKIYHSNYTEVSFNTEHDNDVGGLFFGKKYAYVESVLKIKNIRNIEHTYKLKFDVNVNGEYHSSTGLKFADVTVTT